MEVIIRRDADAVAALAARLIAARVREKPGLVLGLATGRTMERVYDRLAAMRLDVSACRSFNLDEYIGLPADDEHSYRRYMDERLFSRVNILRANTHVPDGMAADLGAEAARYERLIRDAGGIELQLLGIGEAGHIGFNEPLSALMSRYKPAWSWPRPSGPAPGRAGASLWSARAWTRQGTPSPDARERGSRPGWHEGRAGRPLTRWLPCQGAARPPPDGSPPRGGPPRPTPPSLARPIPTPDSDSESARKSVDFGSRASTNTSWTLAATGEDFGSMAKILECSKIRRLAKLSRGL